MLLFKEDFSFVHENILSYNEELSMFPFGLISVQIDFDIQWWATD
ncbi:hypothetical protein B23_2437 [Geobacillus thermoleovorans B23]|nr:hypothetical protein B23_2437 [Geobacillus thermoleovorans B23]